MSIQSYSEFEWLSGNPANGESGRKLGARLVTLIRSFNEVESVCDLGCGNGYLASLLASSGYDVVGIDASISGINQARQSGTGARFIRSNIDRDVLARTGLLSVDLVVSSDVIEHMYRPSDLLEAAAILLKPKGRFVITTPYHGYLKNVALAVSGRMDRHFSALHDGGHIKFFSVNSLSKLLRQNSFVDLKFSYFGRAPWLWKNMICHARIGASPSLFSNQIYSDGKTASDDARDPDIE